MKVVAALGTHLLGIMLLCLLVNCVAAESGTATLLNLNVSCSGEQLYFCTLFNLTARYNEPLVIENASQNKLTELALRSSKIRRIPSDIFLQTPKLQAFIMHDCALNGLDKKNFQNATTLRRLVLQGNQLYDLPEQVFSALYLLEQLHLGQNTLQLIHRKAFTNLGKLRYLDLQQNNIHWMPESALSELPALEHIDLSSNQINIINVHTFAANPQLHTVLLANNQFKVFQPRSLEHLPHLHLLDVTNSSLDELYLQSVETLLASNCGLTAIQIAQGAVQVHAAHNKLKLGKFIVGDKLAVCELNLHDNQLEGLDDVVGMLNLQRLDLSHNLLTTLSTSAAPLYLPLPSLTYLNLAKNSLHELCANSFLLLSKLKHLDLAFNNLQSLDLEALAPMLNLNELYINGNHLLSLEYEQLLQTHVYLRQFGIYDNNFEPQFLSNMIAFIRSNNVQLPVRNLASSGLDAEALPYTMANEIMHPEHIQTKLGVSGIHPYWTTRDVLTVVTLCFVLLILLLNLYRLLREEECCVRWLAARRARRQGVPGRRDRMQRLSEDDSEV